MTAAIQSLDPETFRRLAAYVGLPATEAHLDELRPRVEAYLRGRDRLRALSLQGVEPALMPAPLTGPTP